MVTPVRYRVTGSGEPLVLVHGLAGSWRWWSPVLGPLAARRRVYVVNLPRLRHPVRAALLSKWLARWLDAAGLDYLELAGHSLGGLVAAELAATRPGANPATRPCCPGRNPMWSGPFGPCAAAAQDAL
jgi:pimeloyl-ACP methyl ester carboxylesterase